jgi:hypothetical protein
MSGVRRAKRKKKKRRRGRGTITHTEQMDKKKVGRGSPK